MYLTQKQTQSHWTSIFTPNTDVKIWTRPTNKNSWSLNKQDFVQKSKLKNLNSSLFYPLIPDLHVMPFFRCYMNIMTSFGYMNMCHDVWALMLATQERRSPEQAGCLQTSTQLHVQFGLNFHSSFGSSRLLAERNWTASLLPPQCECRQMLGALCPLLNTVNNMILSSAGLDSERVI